MDTFDAGKLVSACFSGDDVHCFNLTCSAASFVQLIIADFSEDDNRAFGCIVQ